MSEKLGAQTVVLRVCFWRGMKYYPVILGFFHWQPWNIRIPIDQAGFNSWKASEGYFQGSSEWICPTKGVFTNPWMVVFLVVNVGKYISPMDAMGMVGFDVLCIYVLFGYSFFSGALTVSFREGFWGQKPHRIQPRQARRKVCSTSVVTDKSDLEKTLGLIWMWGHHENHASHNKVSQEEVQKVR